MKVKHTSAAKAKRLGAKLRKARTALGYTLEHVAREARTCKSTVHYLEQGSREPNVFLLNDIADVLDLSIQDLLK